ncbi:hypothetical protein [Propionispora vibrioides]|jgi:hypothetical protein|uniref:Uncharacterized protein n=1 Tax=Propionispora vibrioides TaxID=112903 RepID=A0A1H8X5Y2_9FIRM|nr:hypothetical protein [Propionispora vibrioides]SEP35326.1 hypothetical protein SAMN04490178_12072 [Propionispora vibrioides]
MCKYDSHHFWEGALAQKRDLWQSNVGSLDSADAAVFINTTILDYGRNRLDNNWACYSDVKSLLGFVQYVYLPLAFYYVMHQNEEELLIPMCSTQELVEQIRQSGSAHAAVMERTLDTLSLLWELDDESCLTELRRFCIGHNEYWEQTGVILHIGIYADTYEIARDIMAISEFPEVVEEDIGLTGEQLLTMCRHFYEDALMRRNFVKILNNRIGCLI